MPVSTRSKAKAGEQGAKTTRDSASEKRGKRLEDGYTAAERCANRLARQSKATIYARDNRYLAQGEQVLKNPLIRDISIHPGLNPYKLTCSRCWVCASFTEVVVRKESASRPPAPRNPP